MLTKFFFNVRNSGIATGTPAALRSKKNFVSIRSATASMQEYQLLEQVHVLFVLEQRAVQRRQRLLRIARAQRFGRNLLRDEQLDPVEQLGGRGFLPQARRLAQAEERRERFGQQVAPQSGVVHVDD